MKFLDLDRIQWKLPLDVLNTLYAAPKVSLAANFEELEYLACQDNNGGGWHSVGYNVPGAGWVEEARTCHVTNGIAVNYLDPYMRRRDPDCMVIGDDLPSDKPRYRERFGTDFSPVRKESLLWLSGQDLVLVAFAAGGPAANVDALAIVPANAGFFALGLALLQGIHTTLPENFEPRAILFVIPPFRHSHFHGKQIVVHDRSHDRHEIFSYNLYPGPSAKKGIYGVLIHHGEPEGWVTAHCSTVEVVTPYENHIAIMHEGASGSGKSEMLEHVHREDDGSLLLGSNVISGETRHLLLPKSCTLRPVNDDMALCTPGLQKGNGKLTVTDAEAGWFIRVNHIVNYGTDPDIESLTIHPKAPLLFLNIDAQPGSTALLWEHIEDEPGRPCPNPRVIVPRTLVPDVLSRPVSVDVRTFGVRTPPCTHEKPTYGIIGLFHVLPPALAWIWRLVAPRGHDNPSIVDSETMSSEGVGSYWPFATGCKIPQANLLLRQIVETPLVRYLLCPNQYVGAWKVGFMPQWIMREYVARRGGVWFHADQISAARCPLLGYSIKRIMVEGQDLDEQFFSVEKQPEVGLAAYDAGSTLLQNFFHTELQQFLGPAMDPLGRKIIECCLAKGNLTDYLGLIPSGNVVVED
jgi:hypothetical protein